MQFEDYTIEAIHLEKEVNYVVSRFGDYLFRLVPAPTGFELSKLDLALDCEQDIALLPAITIYLTTTNKI